MMVDALITLISVVALLLGSPGPAPLTLAAVGASVGTRQGLPFLCGILMGLTIVIISSALGLSVLFKLYPSAWIATQIIGGLYLLYIAIKIATAPVATDQEPRAKAPSCIDGIIFNLLNPKAYAAFFAIFSHFLLPISNPGLAYLCTGIVCLLVATCVDAAWLMLGSAIKPIFSKPVPARLLRITFAVLMVLAVIWSFNQAGP